jgi:hypothetical protein
MCSDDAHGPWASTGLTSGGRHPSQAGRQAAWRPAHRISGRPARPARPRSGRSVGFAAAGSRVTALARDPDRESAAWVSRFERAVKPSGVEVSLASLPQNRSRSTACHVTDGHRAVVVSADVRAGLHVRARPGWHYRQSDHRSRDRRSPQPCLSQSRCSTHLACSSFPLAGLTLHLAARCCETQRGAAAPKHWLRPPLVLGWVSRPRHASRSAAARIASVMTRV